MPSKDALRRWTSRFLLSVATTAAVSGLAYLCAWGEYRDFCTRNDFADQSPTFWKFANDSENRGIHAACLLGGVVAFLLCLISSATVNWPGTRSALVKIVIANAITALFAIAAAVAMSILHLQLSGH